MPWMETSPVEQRERFIRDHRLELYTMAELCARYGISRKTGYKWLERFEDAGRQGLRDRSRAPQRCPHRITDAVAALICAARRQHPSWGPAKLVASRRRPRDHGAAQRSLDRRLQGPLPDPRWSLLLPADDCRPAYPLPPGVPRPALDPGAWRAPRLRPALPRVRPTACHSHRQRRPLRHDRDSWSLATQRVVATLGHSAPTDLARPAPAERRARAHA